MLEQEKLVAFMATSNADAARAFYEGVLGLRFAGDHDHLIVFETDSARLMLQKTDVVKPPHGTALGWSVRDLKTSMADLAGRGVAFEHFDGLEQDERGVWRPEGPASGVCWFKDPDGNLLSLSQSAGA